MNKPPVPISSLKWDIRSFSWTLFSTSPRQLQGSPVLPAWYPQPPHQTQHWKKLYLGTNKLQGSSISLCMLHSHHSLITPSCFFTTLLHYNQAKQQQRGDRAPPGPQDQYQEIFWLNQSLPSRFIPLLSQRNIPSTILRTTQYKNVAFSISLTNCPHIAAVTVLLATSLALLVLQWDAYMNLVSTNPAPANIM